MKRVDPNYATKSAVAGFVRTLSDNTRLAILIFDQQVKLVVPLTLIADETRDSVLTSLQQLNYRGLFTNIPTAMEQALYELQVNGRARALKSIILLTDGVVDTGDKARDRDGTRWLQQELGPGAARSKIRIYGVALADKADFQLLQSLAHTTQGDYFRAYQAEDMPGAFERIHRAIVRDAKPPKLPESEPSTVGEVQTTGLPAPAPASQPVRPEKASGIPQVSPPSPHPAKAAPISILLQNMRAFLASLEAFLREPKNRWLLVVGAILLVAPLIIWALFRQYNLRRAKPKEPVMTLATVERIPQAFLYDLHGVTGIERYELSSKTTSIGRIAPDIEEQIGYLLIDRDTIGRRHALIEYKGHNFWVTDQASRNGTFVNGKRISGVTYLKHDDRIRFHDVEFSFEVPGMEMAQETVMAEYNYDEVPTGIRSVPSSQVTAR